MDKNITALEGNNGTRIYYDDGTIEQVPGKGKRNKRREIGIEIIKGKFQAFFYTTLPSLIRIYKMDIEKYKQYWDNFNVELYALIKQVKKNKSYEQ